MAELDFTAVFVSLRHVHIDFVERAQMNLVLLTGDVDAVRRLQWFLSCDSVGL